MALKRWLGGLAFLSSAHCAWVAPAEPVRTDDQAAAGGRSGSDTSTHTSTATSTTPAVGGAGPVSTEATILDFDDGKGQVALSDGTRGSWAWGGEGPTPPASIGAWDSESSGCIGPFLGAAGGSTEQATFEVRFATATNASGWAGVEAEVWMPITWYGCVAGLGPSVGTVMSDCAAAQGASQWSVVRATWEQISQVPEGEVDPAALTGFQLAYQGDTSMVCVHAIRFFR